VRLLLFCSSGAFIVIGIHAVVSVSIRNVAASGYYRKKPLVANATLLIRECGLVALTRWFVFIRAVRLFLTAIFYIGRIDSPILYDSLGQVGNFRIDKEPYLFQIDILQVRQRNLGYFLSQMLYT
jgi:hypothetical protein